MMNIKVKVKIYFFIFNLVIFSVCGLVSADTISLKNSNEVIVGKVLEETETHLIIKEKGGGFCKISKDMVEQIKEGRIPENELWSTYDIYLKKKEKIKPDDPEANLELGKWCLDNKLYEPAYRHIMLAVELDPSLEDRLEDEIKTLRDIKAKKIYAYALKDFKTGDYLKSESTIVMLLSKFPESGYTKDAKDLLIKMWGQEKAEEIIQRKDDLPSVAMDSRQMPNILNSLETEERKEAYLRKCLKKARDFERRAVQVLDKNRKRIYINNAIDCYKLIMVSDNTELKNIARRRIEELSQN